jgi:hypothetical protein
MIETGKTIPGDKHIDADFCNKFAQLIIEECARVGREHVLEKSGVSKDYSGIVYLERAIKDHFGVE